MADIDPAMLTFDEAVKRIDDVRNCPVAGEQKIAEARKQLAFAFEVTPAIEKAQATLTLSKIERQFYITCAQKNAASISRKGPDASHWWEQLRIPPETWAEWVSIGLAFRELPADAKLPDAQALVERKKRGA
jgi:hypothetical protein